MKDDKPSALTRRRVLSTAGTAAWTAPVIVAATAAPAVASSGSLVSTTDVQGSRAGGMLTVSATFTNQSPVPTSAMNVQVVLDAIQGTIQSADPASVTGGFSFMSRSGNSGGRTYVFTKDAPQLSGSATPGTATATLTFEVPATPDAIPGGLSTGTITATPSPTPSAGSPGIGSWI